ncbi:hypothetical protein CVT30_10290 [Streptomyces sp. AMCC400023]|nr:hypothetical protein CVT30_10290 [Streptomyces sp. AMCC400023]
MQGRFGVPAGCFGVPGERYEGVLGVSYDVAAQLGEAWSRAVPEWGVRSGVVPCLTRVVGRAVHGATEAAFAAPQRAARGWVRAFVVVRADAEAARNGCGPERLRT